ncbi:Sec-independent protein translocase protein TatB [uncultured Desulfovibrio sp.]|uniref:Sec-independent protein translocase protein TatB n=1 Tax=uncultured Desulfovibrio sp. TaxID=167968 RepID=UPI0025D499BD|nr:Sec-independent protein translocase protein TatB [uncultured Desulfovibrio sp.]
MFGIGSTELLVILLVALVVLGPKSLAGVSRTLGKAMGEFRRVSTDFQRTLNAEVAREEEDEKQRKAAEARPASAASQTRPAPEAPRGADAGQEDSTLAATLETTARPSDTVSSGAASAGAASDLMSGAPVPPPGSPLEKAVAATQAAAQSVPPAAENRPAGSERA